MQPARRGFAGSPAPAAIDRARQLYSCHLDRDTRACARSWSAVGSTSGRSRKRERKRWLASAADRKSRGTVLAAARAVPARKDCPRHAGASSRSRRCGQHGRPRRCDPISPSAATVDPGESRLAGIHASISEAQIPAGLERTGGAIVRESPLPRLRAHAGRAHVGLLGWSRRKAPRAQRLRSGGQSR